jgi:hypothetical protein
VRWALQRVWQGKGVKFWLGSIKKGGNCENRCIDWKLIGDKSGSHRNGVCWCELGASSVR